MKTVKELIMLTCFLFCASHVLFSQKIPLVPEKNKLKNDKSEFFIVPYTNPNGDHKYNLTIKIHAPKHNLNKSYPIFYYVHGGGWNIEDENSPDVIPPASLPNHAQFLSEKLGVIYVGLSYSCIGNPGVNKADKATFKQALDELKYQIKFFQTDMAKFIVVDGVKIYEKADFSRIGFGGGSAGSALSSRLSQLYPKSLLYVGNEGMYDFTSVRKKDPNTGIRDNSNFPSNEDFRDFGLNTLALRKRFSAADNIKKLNTAPATLLFHGDKDYQCDYSQSSKFATAIRKKYQVGDNSKMAYCKEVRYNNINHTCMAKAYPEVFKVSVSEVANHFIKWFAINGLPYNVLNQIEQEVNTNLSMTFDRETRYVTLISNLINNSFVFEDTNKTETISFSFTSKSKGSATIKEVFEDPKRNDITSDYSFVINKRQNNQELIGGYLAEDNSNYIKVLGNKSSDFPEIILTPKGGGIKKYYYGRKSGALYDYTPSRKPKLDIMFYKVRNFNVPTASANNPKISNTKNISNKTQEANARVYPVPANDVLYVSNMDKDCLYSIYNLSGQTIVNKRVMKAGSIDVSALPSGFYIIKFQNKDILKFVKN